MDTNNEKCVCCGGDTGVLASMPIELRNFFVERCGQLCEGCYLSLGHELSLEEKHVSNEEMELLLEEVALNSQGD